MNKADKTTGSYFVVTYGCQMNEADSEKIEAYMQKEGYKRADSWKKADVVIINTCSVRQSAEDRVLGLVNNLSKLPQRPKIVLTGCMLRYTTHKLKKMLPDVDEFILLKELIKDHEPIRKDSKSSYAKASEEKHAWVPIMRGCDNFCTYCVVPYSRGRERSRPIEEIYCEVKELVKRGYKHVTLLGQNVNSYGKGLKIENCKLNENCKFKIENLCKEYKNNFAVLLALLHEIKGLKKISFITSNPHDMTKGIIKAMSLPKIDRNFHLPVQSGDDEILKKMNRKYTAKEYLQLIKEIKKQIPDIKISTDIIVGFPGESNEQFENTLKLCKKVDFCKAYINKYSPRPGTAAFKLKDNVPIAEKKRRWKVLNKLINEK